MAARKRETHELANDSVYFIGDWLETRLKNAGQYKLVLSCTCNRLITIGVELWVQGQLTDTIEQQVLPNNPLSTQISFETVTPDTDIRVSILNLTGANVNVDLSIDSEVLTSDDQIPALARRIS
jgi:hypothetical protein